MVSLLLVDAEGYLVLKVRYLDSYTLAGWHCIATIGFVSFWRCIWCRLNSYWN